ncbi:MAG: AbiEi antitoxin N-terminal domain-containing protein [Solirubrobacterales bacterium]
MNPGVVDLCADVRDKPRPRPPSEGSVSLSALAERQHGIVSIRQLLTHLGYSRSTVARAVASGWLVPMHRGVYAVGHTAISRHGHSLAAVLSCGPRALLSHRSAAWLWGLARYEGSGIEVTSPTPRRPRPPIVLHRARGLLDQDRRLEENIPVTSVARTLLDFAATVEPERLTKAIERSEELELFDLRAVDDLLERTVGHPGYGRLRRALELYRPAPFSRSGLEIRFLELVEQAGLPKPVTGFNEVGYELDVYWPGERLVVELDVYETHGSRAAFERDRVRQEDLLLAGIRMTRVTGPRLKREPQAVIKRVRRLLSQTSPSAA